MRMRLMAAVFALLVVLFPNSESYAQGDTAVKQAKRLCEGLTGVVCSPALIEVMTKFIKQGAPVQASLAAIDFNDNFYRKLKNQVHKLSNEDRIERGPLNSFTALIIGMTRDEVPFDQVMYGDIFYVADEAIAGKPLPDVSKANDDHFQMAEETGKPLKELLKRTTQSAVGFFEPDVAAGILTTPTFGHSYFLGGTNRAVLAYTYDGFLCHSIEQLHDNTRPKNYIAKDVTFAPAGDPLTYLQTCTGCHAGMDAQRPAFWGWDFIENLGLNYDPTRPLDKLVRNATENPHGFEMTDDKWINLWTEGKNASLGWNGTTEGRGLKSWGQMLSRSNAFSQCWAERALVGTCLIDPESKTGLLAINSLASQFRSDWNYSLKQLYANAALMCSR